MIRINVSSKDCQINTVSGDIHIQSSCKTCKINATTCNVRQLGKDTSLQVNAVNCDVLCDAKYVDINGTSVRLNCLNDTIEYVACNAITVSGVIYASDKTNIDINAIKTKVTLFNPVIKQFAIYNSKNDMPVDVSELDVLNEKLYGKKHNYKKFFQ